MGVRGMNTPQNATTVVASAPAKKRGRWLIWLLGFVLLIAAGVFWLWIKITEPYLWGFGPREMAVAQYTPKDVVGDLGGMKVTIPRHIPELVEYNGDPGWGEKRKGPRPQRTHDSKLMSFGFDVRYPDMATFSSPELRADKKAQNDFQTMWLDVGVTTGQHYPRDGAMDSRARYTIDVPAATQLPWTNHYTQLPHKEYGLTVYTLQDLNPKTGKPAREDRDAEDVYIARNARGQVTTFIECDTQFRHSMTCQHNFSMEYDGVKALIRVYYRPGLRAHWRDIQAKVTRLILSFKATPEAIATSTTPQAAPPASTPVKN
jgi:hypothetical protein